MLAGLERVKKTKTVHFGEPVTHKVKQATLWQWGWLGISTILAKACWIIFKTVLKLRDCSKDTLWVFLFFCVSLSQTCCLSIVLKVISTLAVVEQNNAVFIRSNSAI